MLGGAGFPPVHGRASALVRSGSTAGWYEFVDDICTDTVGLWYTFEVC